MGNILRREDILAMSGLGTIEDIYDMPQGQRAELLDGQLYLLAAPGLTHQRLLLRLYEQITDFIKKRKGDCETFLAPFAVFLMNDDRNYVEPDLLVVCDSDKLDEAGCHGAPDLIIEIVSDSSKSMDYYKKLNKYQEAGVREYWIVDPLKKLSVVYYLEQEEPPVIYPFAEGIPSRLFEGLIVELQNALEPSTI